MGAQSISVRAPPLSATIAFSMRWITFFILLFFMYPLQISHLGAWPHGPHGNDPWPALEYLPLLAVFYALFAADNAGAITALCCGLAYDIGNHEFAGTSMIPLTLVALLLIRIRLSIFREHALSQFIMTLLAIFTFAFLSALFRGLIGAPLYGRAFWPHFLHLAGNALYTALIAPAVFRLFLRFPKLLGFSVHGARAHRLG